MGPPVHARCSPLRLRVVPSGGRERPRLQLARSRNAPLPRAHSHLPAVHLPHHLPRKSQRCGEARAPALELGSHTRTVAPEPKRLSIAELAAPFLKLGTIAFGGPAAHIAMMEDELVRRRGWITREEFLDLLGAATLLPGPTSTEVALHIGRLRGGWRGLLVTGFAFILPA